MKDYFGYQEKVVIVTGASSGMGKATAVDVGGFRSKSICARLEYL